MSSRSGKTHAPHLAIRGDHVLLVVFHAKDPAKVWRAGGEGVYSGEFGEEALCGQVQV
jgi:hypothetical protein